MLDNSFAALTHPTRGLSGLASTTLACHYLYKPPGTGSSETSRLPWYNRAQPAGTSNGGGVATATNEESPAAPQQQSSSAPSPPSPLHLQNISTILQSAAAVNNNNNTGVNTAMAPPAAAASPSSSPSFHNNPAASRSATPTAAAVAVNASSAFAARTAIPSVPSPPASVSVSAATAAAAAAALRRSDVGALRLTPTRRMSAISGPTLDVRVEDIVKVEETLASELTLPKVVQLLIDPQAEGVEQITMGEFAAMLPKRQLIAVGGKKEWLQWIEQSTHYQQAARLAAESPAQDLAALQQAGIFSLQQWLEHPQLVRVSARTRSALDTAVAQSVEAYMAEVAQVVNTSNAVEDLLVHWVSDVLGRFVLESLQLPLERASQAMWTARKDWMPADVVRNGGGLGTASATRGADVTGGGAPQSAESRVLSEMLGGAANSAAAQQAAQQQQQQQRPLLRAGEACTLDHYLRFVQKVVSSVRKDYVANHAAMGHGSGARGDAQAEQEIAARSNDVIAAALVQLLEQAVLHSLPNELRTLQQSGYLALDRIPGLLKRASNLLQLRAVPVRFFVFHSAVDEAARSGSNGAAARSAAASNAGAAAAAAGGLSVPAPPHYPPGTFLTGSRQLDVTLGEWTGRPDPPSSTARETGSIVDDTTEQEYLSVLHRLRRRVDTLAVTSLYEVVAQPERYGGNGFSAVEALGLQQLFGPVKLLEDRLTSALHYPVAAAEKPIHFVAAGPLSGKTALLEQLAERATRPGDKVVLVRYGGSATPYLPDIDDHPVAFAARFWFRAALASCPYLIRTEELYSRAPRSVFWWGHKKNWSWERYQSLLQSAHNAGAGHRQQQQQRGMAGGPPAQLASILVDDVDRALGPMQQKWGDAAALSAAAHASVSAFLSSSSSSSSISSGGGSGVHGGVGAVMNGALTSGSLLPAAMQKTQHPDDDADDVYEEEEDGRGGEGGSSSNSAGGANGAAASRMTPAAADPGLSLEQQRQQVVALWLSTGKSVEEHLASCFTQLSAAVGQVNLVFTGTAVTPLLLAYCAAPCRRYYLPLSGGVGLQSRLRVLPLLATLHALHLTHHLDMPGLLYEVVKNCPALAGKALELFWTHRVSTMDLRTGLPRLTMGSGSAHPQLMQSYVPRELFAELPLYTSLLQNPRRSRRRLVELLQRQLSSPTGYLNTELDTTPQDVKDGLVLPHNLTSSQVHPFALFAIFSRQDAIDERVFNSEGQLLNGSEATEGGEAAEADAADDGDAARGDGDAAAAAAAARVRSRTGVGNNERKVVRAWAEVWAEYRGVVAGLSTSPARKRDAMRILLHGALLLRSAAVAGAQLELNLKVPSYGFPLLASETRVRSSSAAHARGDAQTRAPTPETVRRATAAYKMFFSNAAPSHFPFRPMVGLNGGCDVVFVCGSTLALYDIVTTAAQLRHVVLRFAEALLGVLHVLERQVFPVDKVRAVQFVTVVSLDEPRPGPGDAGVSGIGTSAYYGRRRGGSVGSNAGGASSAASAAGGMSVDVFAGSSAATVPYYLDYDAIFDDDVMDRLRELQQPLGITRDFRTLSELIDEVERSHRVRVMQDIVSTPEEVESLFSPTLLQLVPDSTVLPAYTSAMVSAADLMMQAMKGGSASAGGGSGGGGSGGGMNGSGSNTSASAALASGRDAARIDVDDDDDDDADYVNLGEDEVAPGAELDDAASDAAAGKSDLLVADLEHLHESAELLEAMMNDNLDMMSDSTARLREQREETAHDLRRDLVMEDRINYNAPAPSPHSLAPSLPQGAAAMAAAGGNTAAAAPQSRRAVPGRTAAEEAEADALAWLHDIISPESLIAGLKGTAPGAGTALANRASSASPSGVSAAAPGQQLQQPQQQQQQAQQQSAVSPGGGGVGNFSAFAATAAAAGGGVMHPWTPNVPAAAAADGTESIAAVFPRTAAKRDEAGRGDAPSAAPATEASGGNSDDDADVVQPEKTSSVDDGDDGGDADADAEEINLQKLFDAVSSNRRRSGRATSAATSSRQQRRGGATASGRRGSGTGSSSSSAKAKAKGKKAGGGASSSASKSKAKASAASGGKKKASAAKKKK